MGVNIIDSSFETNTTLGSGQPFDAVADIDFMQYGIRDGIAGVSESMIGEFYDPAETYILKGCQKTSDGTTTTIAPGYILGISKALGGMVARTYLYTCAGMSFLDPSGGDVVVGKVQGFPSATDPITFTDGGVHTIHQEYRVVFGAGASGSQDVDYSDLILAGAWVDAGTPDIVTAGVGVGAGVVGYNRFRLNNRTVTWQLNIVGFDISGSPTGIVIRVPAALKTIGANFTNTNGISLIAGVYNSNGSVIYYAADNTISALYDPFIELSLPATAAFTDGTGDQSISVSIELEMLS